MLRPRVGSPPHHLILWSARTYTHARLCLKDQFGLCSRPQPSVFTVPSKFTSLSGSCLLEPPAWCSTKQGVKSPLRTSKGHRMLLFISHSRLNRQIDGFLTLFVCSFTNSLRMSHSLVFKSIKKWNDQCTKLDLPLNKKFLQIIGMSIIVTISNREHGLHQNSSMASFYSVSSKSSKSLNNKHCKCSLTSPFRVDTVDVLHA